MDKSINSEKNKLVDDLKSNHHKTTNDTTKHVSATKSLNNQSKFPRDEIEAKVKNFFEANKDFQILVSVVKLMEAGAHIGLPRQMWNPKMSPFIYKSKRLSKTIIDILKIIVFLSRAYSFLHDIAENGGKILFVGTHNTNVKGYVKDEATRAGAFYVNQRWLGGTLTNYRNVSNSINKLNKLTSLLNSDSINNYTKKQRLDISRKVAKMEKFIGGIKEINGLPNAIIVADPILEHNAVKEARDLHIPVIAIANTNANPNLIDFIIPANTYSIKTQWLILSILADAIASANGKEMKIVGKKDGEIILPETIKTPRKIVYTKGTSTDTFVNKKDKK